MPYLSISLVYELVTALAGESKGGKQANLPLRRGNKSKGVGSGAVGIIATLAAGFFALKKLKELRKKTGER